MSNQDSSNAKLKKKLDELKELNHKKLQSRIHREKYILKQKNKKDNINTEVESEKEDSKTPESKQS